MGTELTSDKDTVSTELNAVLEYYPRSKTDALPSLSLTNREKHVVRQKSMASSRLCRSWMRRQPSFSGNVVDSVELCLHEQPLTSLIVVRANTALLTSSC